MYARAFALFLGVCGALLVIRLDHAVYSEENARGELAITQFLLNQWLFPVLLVAAVAGMALLAGLAVAGLARGAPLYALASILLIPVAPRVGFEAVLRNLAPRTTHGRLVEPDGTTYVFLDQSFLQGQRMVLGRVRHESWVSRLSEAVGSNNGDTPRSYAHVIRPAGAPEAYGQLYRAQCGLIVGLRTAGRAFFAYDARAKAFYGHYAIENLSPFVLLGADTALHEEDVATLREAVRERVYEQPGFPREGALRAGLSHPNPRVRELAAELLEIRAARDPKDLVPRQQSLPPGVIGESDWGKSGPPPVLRDHGVACLS